MPETMNIVRAAETDLPAIRRLIQTARYRYADYGIEDLPSLVGKAECRLGLDADNPWGFIGVQVEARPPTLPAFAPPRAYLRALALRTGHAPRQFVAPLLAAVEDELRRRAEPPQIITYSGDPWMEEALLAAGYATADEVQFFELDRLRQRSRSLPKPAGPAHLQPARAPDLEALARLDAAAFPPLWHFSRQDLLELLMRSRFQVAWHEDEAIGYAALIANSGSEAQLARLAVRPDVQGRGVGRQLLADAIHYAAHAGYRAIVLNTQTDNARSQRLYRAFSFLPIADPIAVLAHTLG